MHGLSFLLLIYTHIIRCTGFNRGENNGPLKLSRSSESGVVGGAGRKHDQGQEPDQEHTYLSEILFFPCLEMTQNICPMPREWNEH